MFIKSLTTKNLMNQSMKVQTGCTGKKNTLIIEKDRNSRGGGETILISMKFPLANLSTHRDICVYIVHSYHLLIFLQFHLITIKTLISTNFHSTAAPGMAHQGHVRQRHVRGGGRRYEER